MCPALLEVLESQKQCPGPHRTGWGAGKWRLRALSQDLTVSIYQPESCCPEHFWMGKGKNPCIELDLVWLCLFTVQP